MKRTIMNLDERRNSEDRRRGSIFNNSLPFLTKDGLVFHERRVNPDRRRSGERRGSRDEKSGWMA